MKLEIENERLSSDVQQQKQEVDFKVKELDKVKNINNYDFNLIYSPTGCLFQIK